MSLRSDILSIAAGAACYVTVRSCWKRGAGGRAVSASGIVAADPRQACVARFRREYGRLCHLSAEALASGAGRQDIYHAMRNEGTDSRYSAIRRQRRNVEQAFAAGQRAGVASRAMTDSGVEVAIAVQAEFAVRLPLVKA